MFKQTFADLSNKIFRGPKSQKQSKKIKCAINFRNSKNVIVNNLDEPRIYVGKNLKKIKIHKYNYLSHFIIDLLPKFANFANFENFEFIFSRFEISRVDIVGVGMIRFKKSLKTGALGAGKPPGHI